MEIWKDIPGYEGKYQVSNFGNVKSLNYHRTKNEKFLTGKIDKDGYRVILLSRNQKKKSVSVHRLVAEAFIPNLNNKPEVNHKDRDKQNNVVSNLEWVTSFENTQHCIRSGRKTHKKPVLQFTKNNEFIASWDSIAEASLSTGIKHSNISACCNKRKWYNTAGGYIWRYKEAE